MKRYEEIEKILWVARDDHAAACIIEAIDILQKVRSSSDFLNDIINNIISTLEITTAYESPIYENALRIREEAE